MDLLLLLAQDSKMETASKTVTLLERVIQGGVPLICLAVAAIFGVACFYLYRQNRGLTEEQLARDAKAQQERAALEKDYREKVEALLREMLERGEDSQEIITNNTTAVRDMTAGLQQLTTRSKHPNMLRSGASRGSEVGAAGRGIR